MKPKEFIFKKKGYCFKGFGKRDYKNRKKGIIYLSNTQFRIIFKNGGERIIPLDTIKDLSLYKIRNDLIFIQTETNEEYTFGTYTPDYIMKLYRLLSEVMASLSDGRDAHVAPIPRSGLDLASWCYIIIVIIVAIFALMAFFIFRILEATT